MATEKITCSPAGEILDLYGLTEICSYCSKKWVELHSAKFVWVYYLFLFDLINISLSLSYGVYS